MCGGVPAGLSGGHPPCFRRTSCVLRLCITPGARRYHACFPPVSRMLPVCITRTFRLYHACYRFASRVLSVCIMRVTGLHHAYFPSASRVLPICITRERVLTSRVFWFVNRRDVRWTSRVMSDSRWRDVRHTLTVPLPDPCCGSSHTAATFRQPEGRSVAESHFFPLSLPRENV